MFYIKSKLYIIKKHLLSWQIKIDFIEIFSNIGF